MKNNKGIIPQIKEIKSCKKVINVEITSDDIKDYIEKLNTYGIKSKEIAIIKYCPHKRDFHTLHFPFDERDCKICHDEIMNRFSGTNNSQLK